jgi:hypothetical protein
MIRAFKSLTINYLKMTLSNSYRFGGLPANFLQTDREKNTEIISLTVEGASSII